MASYTGSPASGKQGDIVYSRNRYGQYTRILRIPVNPNSPRQSTIRSRFTTISEGWRNLTSAQRLAWRTFAQNNPVYSPKINGFIELQGNAMFVKINQQRLVVGLSITSDPIAAPSFVSNTPAVVITATGPVYTIGGTDQPSGYKAVISASAPVSLGVSFPKQMKQVTSIDASAWSTPIDVATAYAGVWGSFTTGKRIFTDIQLVSDTGWYGAKARVNSSIGA